MSLVKSSQPLKFPEGKVLVVQATVLWRGLLLLVVVEPMPLVAPTTMVAALAPDANARAAAAVAAIKSLLNYSLMLC